MTHVATAVAPARRSKKGWIAAGVAALLAITGIVAVGAPALASPGMTGVVSGTITLPISGDKTNAQVSAFRFDSGANDLVQEDSTTAASDGTWSFSELPVGDYEFYYEWDVLSDGLVNQFTHGEYSNEISAVIFDNQFVTLAEDDTYDTTFGFHEGGTVTATITGTGGSPVSGANLELFKWSFDTDGNGQLVNVTSADTAPDGTVDFIGLSDGDYTAQYSATGYATQLYDNTYGPDPSYGNTFSVSGGVSSDISTQLAVGSDIQGFIKNASGVGIDGVEVWANQDDGFNWNRVGFPVTTSSTGFYDLSGLAPGVYRIEAVPGNTDYQPRTYKTGVDVAHGTDVTVGAGQTKPNINITLIKSSTISGKITLTGAPGVFPADGDISIIACVADSFCGPDFISDMKVYNPATGAYSLPGLAAGKYNVLVTYTGAGNFRDEYYNNVYELEHATAIVVGSAANVVSKNVALDPGSSISGTLRDGNGDPVSGMPVGAFQVLNGMVLDERPLRFGTTDVDGHYSVGGLPTGTFAVRADPSGSAGIEGFVGEWYGHTYNPDHATRVKVTIPNGVTGIDVTVTDSAIIHGQVTASDTGLPIQDSSMHVYRFDTPGGTYEQFAVGAYAYTDDAGFYSVEVPPGEYVITTDGDGVYRNGGYGAGPDEDAPPAGTRITVASGESFDASFPLLRGGAYTGRVIDHDGLPVSGLSVSADDGFFATETAADGTFKVEGLSEGSHLLGIASFDDTYVSVMTVQAPGVFYNVLPYDLGEIVLPDGSGIHGVVRTAAGAALANVEVNAYTSGSRAHLEWVGSGYSAANGSFDIAGLPTGTIYLKFRAPGITYPDQYLGGSTIWALSDPVSIVDPGTTKTVEARLVAGGAVTGVVKNKATGRVIPGVDVGVSQTDPSTGYLETYAGATTNTKGAYIVPGLEAGGYDVSFNGYATGPGLAYTPSTTSVTVGTTNVTVNGALVPQSKVSGVIKIGTTVTEGVRVTATRTDGATTEATTSATGSYTLALDTGAWTLFVSDPEGRASSAYWKSTIVTGTDDAAAASTVTVTGNGAAQTGKNVTLSASGGTIAGTIGAPTETDPTGSFQLVRIQNAACGDVLSTQTFTPGIYGQPLNDLFPIHNVRAGDYCLVVDATSALSNSGGPYPQLVSGPFTVTDGATVNLGNLDPGTPSYLTDYRDPIVVIGSEPTISGPFNAKVGDFLTASTGNWTRNPQFYFFQWTRDGKPIRGAAEQTYQLTPGDAGKHIAVNLGASDFNDGYQIPLSYTAEFTPTIGQADPSIALTPPSISGKPNVGQTLTADPGTWDTPGLTFHYSWTRDGAVVGSAKTYKLTTLDAGTDFDLEVTASRAGFEDGEAGIDGPQIVPAIAMKATKLPMVSVNSTHDGWTVTNGTWTPASSAGAPITYSFAWRGYSPTTGEASSFASGAASGPVGEFGDTNRITVIVTASKQGYTPTSIEIPVRTAPAPTFVSPPGADFTAPALGVPIEVSAIDSNPPISPAHTGDAFSTVGYQWYRSTTVHGAFVAISGATKPVYIPTATDVGKFLHVRVILKATGYAAQTSAEWKDIEGNLAVVAAPTLAPIVDPTMVGNPWVGRVLKADVGTWSPTPTSYSYQWTRNNVAIPKATASSYTLVLADSGNQIRVTVTAKLGTQSVSQSSLWFDVVTQPLTNVTLPTVPATARVGVKLTATMGTWDLAPTAYTYQWNLNGVPITGAKTSSYLPIVGDLGEDITVTAVAKRTGLENSAATSSLPVTVEKGAAMLATKAPALKVATKTVTSVAIGKTVVATPATWPALASSLSYHWESTEDGVTWSALAGETGTSLVVGSPVAAGDKVRFVVVAIRSGYLPSTSVSAPLTVVAAP